MSKRLVAVLGYSGRRHHGLHDLCAERLRHAEQLAGEGDTVLLSGWARHRNGTGEAELMRDAWRGAEVTLVADATARKHERERRSCGRGGARASAPTRSSSSPRLARPPRENAGPGGAAGCGGRGSSPPGRRPLTLIVRELVCLAALPYHLVRIRTR